MKTRLLLLTVIACAAVLPAASLRPVSFDARVAMELTSPGGGGDYYRLGAGFDAGATVRLPLVRSLYFEPGLFFTYSAMTAQELVTFDDEYYFEGATNMYGLRVPFNFGYTFNLTDNVAMDVFTGPWLNINLSARQKLLPNFSAPQPLPDRKINLFEHGWRRADAQWGFGLSFTFAQSYYIGITGGVGFTPLAKFGNKDKKVRIHRNTVAISLGYKF